MLISIHIFRICAFHSFLFLMKRKALAFCMRYGEPSCVLSKKPQVSLGTQNKRQNWAIVSICCPRERERERGWRVRTPWADRDRIISERERDRGKERVETTATGDRMGSYRE